MQTNGYARLSLNDLDDGHGPVNDTDTTHTDSDENKAPLRPHVYYDEGPFDAPSSESEDETLLEKDAASARSNARSPGAAESGFDEPKVGLLSL